MNVSPSLYALTNSTGASWYIAPNDTPAPAGWVKGARFIDPWPNAWRKIDTGDAVFTDVVTEYHTFSGGVRMQLLLAHPPHEMKSVIRNNMRLALGIEDSAHVTRIVFFNLYCKKLGVELRHGRRVTCCQMMAESSAPQRDVLMVYLAGTLTGPVIYESMDSAAEIERLGRDPIM